MDLKNIKMVEVSGGRDISGVRGVAKGWIQFQILNLDDWKKKENVRLEIEEAQWWNREVQSGTSDIPRGHKTELLLKPLGEIPSQA